MHILGENVQITVVEIGLAEKYNVKMILADKLSLSNKTFLEIIKIWFLFNKQSVRATILHNLYIIIIF